MRGSLLALEMLVRALQGSHLSRLLVLWLLWTTRVHDLVTELLELLLQLEVRVC